MKKSIQVIVTVIVLICFLFVTSPNGPVFANSIIYVSKSGDNTSGTSWVTAYTDLQTALTAASGGDQIWVAAGVYKPGLARTDSFNLVPGVAVYGGFAGDEININERDWETNLTILSGDINGDDINLDGNDIAESYQDIIGDNTLHVVTANGTTGIVVSESTIMDGFIITAGQAIDGEQDFNPGDFGGGFFCDGSGSGSECSPTLNNLIFYGNKAVVGGGLHNSAHINGISRTKLHNITFYGNGATFSGGAINNLGHTDGICEPILENVRFINNHSEDSCGAMINYPSGSGISNPSMTNVLFYNNSAETFGGAICNTASSGTVNAVFTNVTFFNNSALRGGAIYSDGEGEGTINILAANSIFWGNTAIEDGAQIYNKFSNISFLTSLIEDGVGGNGIYNVNAMVTDNGGNLDEDPLFVDLNNGDLHLQFGSPAIDSGNNVANGLPTDLEGYPRIIDGDRDTIAIIDMGAFEFHYLLNISVDGTGTGIVVSDPAGINCGTDCTQDYDHNTLVTLTATPNLGSTFNGWSGACTNATGNCVIRIDEAKFVRATFTLNQYTLTVSTEGSGSGLVTSLPTGISCEGDCTENYDYNTLVTLTAAPNPGSTFAGWSGACTNTSGDCLVTMGEAKSVTASFTINQYTLTISTDGTGNGSVTSDPAGISCENDCTEDYDYNTLITLTATPEMGSSFTEWSGACTNVTGNCLVTMDEAKSVTATFTINEYTLTVSTDGTGNGSVTSDPVGISCEGDCTEDYDYNSLVTLTAIPNTGSTFVGWSGACTNTTGTCQVTIDESKSVMATFTLNQYTLTVSTDGTGSGSVTSDPTGISCEGDCTEDYDYNSLVTLIATPNTGSTFTGWSGACTNASGDCLVRMDEAKSVTAIFTKIDFNVFIPMVIR
ncbi:MAG: hypothetical protein CL609_08325 [Anaerolineaceae bacterium]|nr:hypothetical protein [Anaerolineaceae bacterium]